MIGSGIYARWNSYAPIDGEYLSGSDLTKDALRSATLACQCAACQRQKTDRACHCYKDRVCRNCKAWRKKHPIPMTDPTL